MEPISESFLLTTHEVPLLHLASYKALIAAGNWYGRGPLGAPAGVWQSTVGDLNRIVFLRKGSCVDYASAQKSDEEVRRAPYQLTARNEQLINAVKPVIVAPTAELVELRIYTLYPGALAAYVPLLLDVLPAREKYSSNIGIFTSVTGSSDQLLHMWGYKDAQQRAAVRPAVDEDPEWRAFVPKILPLIQHMQSYFLSPIDFK